VSAHPPGIAYQTRKYLRRHRLGLAVAAIAALAVLLLATWWRIPPAVPVVESVVQLTDDGEPKLAMAADASRIYFNAGEFGSFTISQVPVTGGPSIAVETRIPNSALLAVMHDGSALLFTAANTIIGGFPHGALWLLPLPGGEPNRVADIETANADTLPDGRIIFASLVQGSDTKGTDSRTDWIVSGKDGSNQSKLVSLPGFIGEVSVSPEGRRIFLSQNIVGDRRLFEMAADGTRLHGLSAPYPIVGRSGA
jgi:hypothetical protein